MSLCTECTDDMRSICGCTIHQTFVHDDDDGKCLILCLSQFEYGNPQKLMKSVTLKNSTVLDVNDVRFNLFAFVVHVGKQVDGGGLYCFRQA